MALSGPRVLFVTYGGGHADIVARLLPKFAAQGLPKPIVLALTNAFQHFEGAYCDLRNCTAYVGSDPQVQELGATLAKDFWSPSAGVSLQETTSYLGVSMRDLITQLGPDEAQARYADVGRKAFCPVPFLDQVLQQDVPDIVVTTCHVRMERAAVIAARARGIPTVRIEDLFGYSLLGEYTFGQSGEVIAQEEWPDDVIVMNEATRDIIVSHGFPAMHVHALGQPVFSDWQADYAQVAMPAPLVGPGPLVTYVTPARRDVFAAQTDIFIANARQRPDIRFCIKLHPSISAAAFSEHFPKVPSNVTIVSDLPILPVIKASDLVVLFRSTVGVLCLISATPMLVWDATGETGGLPYVASGAAQPIMSDADLGGMLDTHLAAAADRSTAVVHPLFEVAPQASDAIVSWLANVTEAA